MLKPFPLLPAGLDLIRFQGHRITVRMASPMPTAERGHLLLELEKQLRADWNPLAEVFLEPKGDVNKLRQRLRGVKI